MQRLERNNRRLHYRILSVMAGTLLLDGVSSLNWIARGEDFIIIPAAQVDCNAPPRVNAVQVPTGVETVAEYCQEQASNQQQSQNERLNRQPWGASYWVGDTVCRERRGVDTLCVTPSGAARLRWDVPFQR
jgi:hypothetical protein